MITNALWVFLGGRKWRDSVVCSGFYLIWTDISNEVLVLLHVRLEKMYYKNKPKAGSNITANSDFTSIRLSVYVN